jgi:hypothetical protein
MSVFLAIDDAIVLGIRTFGSISSHRLMRCSGCSKAAIRRLINASSFHPMVWTGIAAGCIFSSSEAIFAAFNYYPRRFWH